jgi:hypothetical protein
VTSRTLSCAFFLLFHHTLLADDCPPKIFPDQLTGRFLLRTELNCESGTESFRTRIFDVNGPTGYFFDRNCENGAVSRPLMYAANPDVLISSSTPIHSNDTVFRVALECMSVPTGFVFYGNRSIDAKPVAIYSWSLNYPIPFGTAIAFQDEFHADEITFRSLNNTVLAHARKTVVNGPCYSQWDVNYSGYDPLLIAYMINWQKIKNMTCVPSVPSAPTSYPSTMEIALMSVFLPAAGGFLFFSILLAGAFRAPIKERCCGYTEL